MEAGYLGFIVGIGPMHGTMGAIVAESLVQKLSTGDKVVAMYIPALDNQIIKWVAATAIFDAYHLPIARDFFYCFRNPISQRRN